MRAKWVGVGFACLLQACASNGRNPAEDGGARVAFTWPSGVRINSVNYSVHLSQSASVLAGVMDISNTNASISFNLVLPPDPAATVSLTATTVAGASCAGASTPFQIPAGATVPVVVQLACGSMPAPPAPGTVHVSANVTLADNCPSIVDAVVAPAQVTVGGMMNTTVTATDPDQGETLSVVWTASAGTFSNPNAATTQYHCDQAGPQTVTVSATDSHVPSCTASVPFTVTCMAP
jgi:hypothetical protein